MPHSSLCRRNYQGASRVCRCWTTSAPKADYEAISEHEAQSADGKTGSQEVKEASEDKSKDKAAEVVNAKPSTVESTGSSKKT